MLIASDTHISDDDIITARTKRAVNPSASASPDTADEDGDAPLHVCASAECVRSLLLAGADADRPNTAGLVPLQSLWQAEDEADEGSDGAAAAASTLVALWYDGGAEGEVGGLGDDTTGSEESIRTAE